jgi:Domain of unknown function (DUF4169)
VSLINLRRARKVRVRAEAEAKARENRQRFGTSKSEQTHEAATQDLEHRRLEAHRRELNPDPDLGE